MIKKVGWGLLSYGLLELILQISDNSKSLKHAAVEFAVGFGCLVSGILITCQLPFSGKGYGNRVSKALEIKVITTAKKNAGRITALEMTAELSVSFSSAKAVLNHLTDSGACQSYVSDDGLIVYYFPEFENKEKALRNSHIDNPAREQRKQSENQMTLRK